MGDCVVGGSGFEGAGTCAAVGMGCVTVDLTGVLFFSGTVTADGTGVRVFVLFGFFVDGFAIGVAFTGLWVTGITTGGFVPKVVGRSWLTGVTTGDFVSRPGDGPGFVGNNTGGFTVGG